MTYTEEFLSPDEILDEHSSDKIFPDLPDGVRPTKVEWAESGCMIEMSCGCMVEVHIGDTLWTVPDGEGSNHLVPVAIDPATIH
jgi:hypothetical protein